MGLVVATILVALASSWVLWTWFRGVTVSELVSRPPKAVDLPKVVTILGYLHHELIKHRLPLVKTVGERPLGEVNPEDVEQLKKVITGQAQRPSVVDELDGYLSGLRSAAGGVHLNFWRDPLVRRTRRACLMIQEVADGLDERITLTSAEHAKLRKADRTLDGWFRPRLQALRNSVLSLRLETSLFEEPITRVAQELGVDDLVVEYPEFDTPIFVRMLKHDFDLVLRNLARNALKVSMGGEGPPKLALEVSTRLELTGEESVLVRIYDVDPRILSRKELYGGAIGRGLNLVTTTLRRYNASLRSARSRRDGYEKYLELRLLRELAEDDAAQLLEEPDPVGWFVPKAALASTVLALTTAGLALSGQIPGLALDVSWWPAVDGADAGDIAVIAPEQYLEAQQLASERLQVATAVGEQAANVAHGAAVDVPGPDHLSVDPRRCAVLRDAATRKLELDCNLVDLDYRLEPPILVLEAAAAYDLKRLDIIAQEFVFETKPGDHGHSTRPAEPEEGCLTVVALSPGQSLPAEAIMMLGPKTRHAGKPSRLLVDYKTCLEKARYPLKFMLTLSSKDVEAVKTEILLDVDLRKLEEARQTYVRIANQTSYIQGHATRRRFVSEIARYTAARLERALQAGSMHDSSQLDLAQALYYGWVRPSFQQMVEERALAWSRRRPLPKSFCAHQEALNDGFKRMSVLTENTVQRDMRRASYVMAQSLLWQFNEVDAALDAFDAFQRQNASKSDFVQGARLYATLLMALTEPPRSPGGVSGALMPSGGDDEPGEKEASATLEQMVRLLKLLVRDAKRPGLRGAPSRYERVKLLGMRLLLQEPLEDESVSVQEAVCGFYEVHQAWVDAMTSKDTNAIFGSCPRYKQRVSVSLLDETTDAGVDEEGDAGVVEGGDVEAVEARALPPLREDERQASKYMDELTSMIREGGVRCERREE